MELDNWEREIVLEALANQQKLLLANSPEDSKSLFKLRLVIDKFKVG